MDRWILAQGMHGANARFIISHYVMFNTTYTEIKAENHTFCMLSRRRIIAPSLLVFSYIRSYEVVLRFKWKPVKRTFLINFQKSNTLRSLYTEHAASKIAQFEATRQDLVSQKKGKLKFTTTSAACPRKAATFTASRLHLLSSTAPKLESLAPFFK